MSVDVKQVAYCKVQPPVGIARVGDSTGKDGYFIAPEQADAPFDTPSGPVSHDAFKYRDAEGRLKRQGARFRIYAYDANDRPLGVLKSTDASIVWSAHLANKKAAWFRFDGTQLARELFRGAENPTASNGNGPRLRNEKFGSVIRSAGGPHGFQYKSTAERALALEISATPRSVSGADRTHDAKSGKPEDQLDFTGLFKGKQSVYLGELATDRDGSLIVLGGRGVSAPVADNGSPVSDPTDAWITNYANNDDWYDDTSDGPVTATVRLPDGGDGGRSVPVHGAWVIVAPPDFAPDTENLVTLYDVMEEVAFETRSLVNAATPKPISPGELDLERDIWPIYRRAADYRWVSLLGLRGHGQGRPGDFFATKEAAFATFSSALAGEGEAFRTRLIEFVRTPIYQRSDGTSASHAEIEKAKTKANTTYMPPLSGDEGDRSPGNPSKWLSITYLQAARLQAWQTGSLQPAAATAKTPGALPDGSLHPDVVTRSVLERCSGGAFFPGIEITSIARDAKLYVEAFRFDHDQLTAGDITKYMAVPWQADFYECHNDWWPAQRPDDVILEDDFKEIFADFQAEQTGDLAGTLERVLLNRDAWERGVGSATPRPSTTFLNGQLMPRPKDGSTLDGYAEQLASKWSETVLTPARDEPGASPWRTQFLQQEACDQSAGRFFKPVVPEPEAVFEMSRLRTDYPELVSAFSLRSLRDLRMAWKHAVNASGRAVLTATRRLSEAYTSAIQADVSKSIKEIITQSSDYKSAIATADPIETLNTRLLDPKNTASELARRHPEEIEQGGEVYYQSALLELRDALLDIFYLNFSGTNGDNAMVSDWKRLGVVVARTYTLADGNAVHVKYETERPRYDGISYRDAFYYAMNFETYPDFKDQALRITEDTLTYAQQVIDDIGISDKNHPESFVPFDETVFRAKLDEIYAIQRQNLQNFDLFLNLRNRNRDSIVRGLLDLAPFNQCDGAWLRRISAAGPGDEVRALLFEIWSDEIGNGDQTLHHATLYTSLLQSLGLRLEPVTSRAYANDPQIPESSYVSPLFEMCISEHTDKYFPEILGMTLFLEWEVLSLTTGILLYDYLGIDSKFYRMHVGIDNATNGHGAKARDAVLLYLDTIRSEGGEAAVQDTWKRIWRGFVAFAAVGGNLFGNDDAIARRRPTHIADRLAEIMTRKGKYGAQNHSTHKIGVHRINDLFEQPALFQRLLASSRWIIRGDPGQSPFMNYLTTFSGPMYKIFDAADLETWRQWIIWLGQEGDTQSGKRYIGKAAAMEALVRALRSSAEAAKGHERFSLAAARSGGRQRIAELFANSDPHKLMRALAAPENGWVVKGAPQDSPLVADMARGGRPMGEALDKRYPEIDNRIGRQILIEWIRAGCPIPGDKAPAPSDIA
ncbi:MAG: hypothetical protein EKK41_19595, partial [Hyphomicrobiales bacterium]